VASVRRLERIENLIREVTAVIIARELAFGEETLVTVTRVLASPDLHYATIFVSVLGSRPDAEPAVLRELSRAAGSMQGELNRRLRMRPVPKITFALDEAEKRRERVEKLLSEEK